jgi:Bacteriophage lambda head decoration protein D
MPVLHEPVHLSDLLKYEAPNLYSRDEVVVASGQSLHQAAGDCSKPKRGK